MLPKTPGESSFPSCRKSISSRRKASYECRKQLYRSWKEMIFRIPGTGTAEHRLYASRFLRRGGSRSARSGSPSKTVSPQAYRGCFPRLNPAAPEEPQKTQPDPTAKGHNKCQQPLLMCSCSASFLYSLLYQSDTDISTILY